MQRLYRRKPAGNWWCAFKAPGGEWVRRSTGKRDRRAAELEAARLERQAADPTRAAKDSTTLADALELFLDSREERGRHELTVKMYRTRACQIVRVLGDDLLVADVDAGDIDRLIAQRTKEGASRNTIGKELTAIRGALKIAARRGWFTRTLESVMPEQWSIGYKPRKRCLRSGAELNALLRELLPDRGAHVLYIVATGASWTESTRARRADIDLQRGTVIINGSKNSYREDRPVPVLGAAWDMLARVIELRGEVKGPLFRGWGNVRRELAQACQRAGIERLTPNDLRRTFGTWLRAQAIEPSLIGMAMGHRDARMVEQVYGRLPAETLGAVLRARLGETSPCERGVHDTGANLRRMTPVRDGKPMNLVPRDGIEPPTRGFSISYSSRPYRNDSACVAWRNRKQVNAVYMGGAA